MKLNLLRKNAQPAAENERPKDTAPEKPRLAESTTKMMAMMDDAHLTQNQAAENRILERLNARQTLTGFIQTAVGLLSEAVDQLILQAFRKDDYAVNMKTLNCYWR